MGILEEVTGLKNQGASENEIVRNLRNQGVSPNEITEALSQAKIKSAVSQDQQSQGQGGQPGQQQTGGMEPSMMGPSSGNQEQDERLPTENISDKDLEPPRPSRSQYPGQQKKFGSMTREVSEGGMQQGQGQEDYSSQDYVPQPQGYGRGQGQYPQYQGQDSAGYQQEYDSYGQQGGYGYEGYGPADNSDTVIEIAEQVFSEKIKDIQKQVEEFSGFKTLAEERIKNVSERLKRIESSLDRLQADILEKVGSYGRGLEGVKKELGMMQETFGKVVNTLADKSEKKHHTTHHTHKKKTKSRAKKKKSSKKK